jgi:hypothetical protein
VSVCVCVCVSVLKATPRSTEMCLSGVAAETRALQMLVQLLPNENREVLKFYMGFLAKLDAKAADTTWRARNSSKKYGPLFVDKKVRRGLRLPPSRTFTHIHTHSLSLSHTHNCSTFAHSSGS